MVWALGAWVIAMVKLALSWAGVLASFPVAIWGLELFFQRLGKVTMSTKNHSPVYLISSGL